jgi:hypothetical protein
MILELWAAYKILLEYVNESVPTQTINQTARIKHKGEPRQLTNIFARNQLK